MQLPKGADAHLSGAPWAGTWRLFWAQPALCVRLPACVRLVHAQLLACVRLVPVAGMAAGFLGLMVVIPTFYFGLPAMRRRLRATTYKLRGKGLAKDSDDES